MSVLNIKPFLDKLIEWSSVQDSIVAVALVGSYAINKARSDSDIDIVIISTEPVKYIHNLSWLKGFGLIKTYTTEDWGLITSLRVNFTDGKEVEFGFTSTIWTKLPIDEDTQRVIIDGIQILVDKDGVLTNTVRSVNKSKTV